MDRAIPTSPQTRCAILLAYRTPMNPFRSLACVAVLGVFSALSFAQGQSGTAGQFDGPAELPRSYVKSALSDTPAPGRTWTVKQGGDPQETLQKASCGDTVQLQAGATFPGHLRLPAKKCDDGHWIIVRTSASDRDLPPEGSRISPCYAGVPSLPARPAFVCPTPKNVLAKLALDKGNEGALIIENGANHYRLIGLEITRDVPGDVLSLALLKKDESADHIVIDRCWFHGTAQDETGKGIQLGGSTYVAVVDSYFSDFHCIAGTGSCTDSQAIGGGNGNLPMGPYKIVNNFLEAAGENILFGGARATVSPADIEIRRNHLFKPITWKKDSANFVGAANARPFIVKNVFELKNGQRVLFEGNILENSWGGFSQTGFAVLLTPKNQMGKAGNLCPACQVTDVTIRYSAIRHVGSCFQIGNGLSGSGGAATAGERYSIHDVICDDVDGTKYSGFGNFAQVSHREPPLHDVRIDHVTAFAPNALLNTGNKDSGVPIANFTFTNSIVTAGQRQITSTGGGKNNCSFRAPSRGPDSVLSDCFRDLKFAGNVIIGGSGWPKNNATPKSLEAVKFAALSNGTVPDYRLRPDSPYKKAGTDGKDPGADIDAIRSATAGVE
jgi:hypothetical protein